jgi:AcrR family transcriptional regulator
MRKRFADAYPARGHRQTELGKTKQMPDESRGRFSTRAESQRNAEILDSSLSCFNEQGCFQTKVDQVVAKVGIGKGTLYRHYASREDLLKGALQKGVDTLRGRCQDINETYATDPEGGARAVIRHFVSLNSSGEAGSPATLARLECGCRWMRNGLDDRALDAVLLPLVRNWQAARLFDETANPAMIAAVIIALVNSPGFNAPAGEPGEEPEASRSFRSSGQTPDTADRLVTLIRRAFPPVSGSVSTADEP